MAISGITIDQLLSADFIKDDDILQILDNVRGGYYNKKVTINNLKRYVSDQILGEISDAVDQNSSDIVVLSSAIDTNTSNIYELSATPADINTQTVSAYTLQISDSSKTVHMIYPTSNVVIIPSESFLTGTEIAIAQIDAGITSISAAPNVYLNNVLGGSISFFEQFGLVTVRSISADYWTVFGSTSGNA